MEFLEKDLEQIIFESSKELLEEKGLTINGKLFRQLRIGNYGIADLITIDRCYKENWSSDKIIIEPFVKINVIELKQNKIDINSFLQAIGYLRGIKSYIEQRRIFRDYDIVYQIILIGKSIDLNNQFCYLCDLLPAVNGYSFLELYTYLYAIDGIKFKYQYGYDLTNKGF